jgi:hypothetical protein
MLMQFITTPNWEGKAAATNAIIMHSGSSCLAQPTNSPPLYVNIIWPSMFNQFLQYYSLHISMSSSGKHNLNYTVPSFTVMSYILSYT